MQLVPLNVPQLPLPQPITENGMRVHSIQYELNECVRFYMWYELCQPLQPQDGQQTKIDYTFSSWNFAFYAFRLRFLDLFIWIKMETLSRELPLQGNRRFSYNLIFDVKIYDKTCVALVADATQDGPLSTGGKMPTLSTLPVPAHYGALPLRKYRQK